MLPQAEDKRHIFDPGCPNAYLLGGQVARIVCALTRTFLDEQQPARQLARLVWCALGGRGRLLCMVVVVDLHPLAAHFVEVADSYERGRPGYTPAVAEAIAAELHLASGARVLDLAAGTGKLTRALLGVGLDVIAVEPQAQLREILTARVGAERVLDGVAEEIPLPTASAHAVTVADAFHWFDHAAALREIRRVLVLGGGLAVLRILPDWRGASWAHQVGTLIAELRPDHPQFDGPRWQDV